MGLEPTTGVSPAPAFEAGSSSSRMTSISGQAAVAGLEPAFVSLTASRLTIGPHRNSWQSAWSDLNRRSRAPEARGFPDFPTRCDCTQRELNPCFRPGETARFRYVIGAVSPGRIVKEHFHCAQRATVFPTRTIGDRAGKSTGWDSNPRRRATRAESSPLDDQCVLSVGPDGLEPSPARLRAECAAANTLIPSYCDWGRRDSNPRRAD